MNISTITRISIAVAISGAVLTLGKMVSLWLLRQYEFHVVVLYTMIASVPYLILALASIGSRQSRSAAVATYLGTLGAVGLGMGVTLNPWSGKYSWVALLAVPFWQFIESIVVWVLAVILAWRFKSPRDIAARFQFSVASLLLGITAFGVLLGLTASYGMNGGLIVVVAVGAAMVVAGNSLRRYSLIWTAMAEIVVGISLTGVLVGLLSPPALIPQTGIVLTQDTPYRGPPSGVFKAGTTVWVNAQTDTDWLVYDANHNEGYIAKDSLK